MATNANSIRVDYSHVFNIIRDDNGGVVYCNKADIELIVFHTSFIQCHVNESSCRGGAIYFSSLYGSLTIKRVLVSECSSYEGHFVYLNDQIEANTCLQYISTEKTFGDWKGVIMLYNSSLYAVYYNTSFCETKIWCNLQILVNAANTTARYLNFYKCQSDILYGTDCHVENSHGIIEYANFLENLKSQGKHGYLFTHSLPDYKLYANHICFFGNSHTLFCGMDAEIIVDDLYYDKLTTTSSIQIKTSYPSATKPLLFEFNIFNQIHFTPDHFNNLNLHFSILTYIFIIFS